MERHKIEVNGGAITEFYHSCHTIRNVWHPRAVGIRIHSMGYTPHHLYYTIRLSMSAASVHTELCNAHASVFAVLRI